MSPSLDRALIAAIARRIVPALVVVILIAMATVAVVLLVWGELESGSFAYRHPLQNLFVRLGIATREVSRLPVDALAL